MINTQHSRGPDSAAGPRRRSSSASIVPDLTLQELLGKGFQNIADDTVVCNLVGEAIQDGRSLLLRTSTIWRIGSLEECLRGRSVAVEHVRGLGALGLALKHSQLLNSDAELADTEIRRSLQTAFGMLVPETEGGALCVWPKEEPSSGGLNMRVTVDFSTRPGGYRSYAPVDVEFLRSDFLDFFGAKVTRTLAERALQGAKGSDEVTRFRISNIAPLYLYGKCEEWRAFPVNTPPRIPYSQYT